MSGFQTHMLIGGVAGLALGRALELFGISPALGLDTMIVQHLGRSGASWASLVSTGLPLIALSALLATVPDIDKSGSYIARRAEAVVTLSGAGLAFVGAIAAKLQPALWLIALTLGAIVGALAGHLLLRLIRRAAGGHRRFTHSFVLAGALALIAGGLWLAHLGVWALIEVTATGGVLCEPVQPIAGAGITTNGLQVGIAPSYQLPQICTTGQRPQWDDTKKAWACVDPITGLAVGPGMTGGGTSGDLRVAADPAYWQRRATSGICTVGAAISAVNEDGTGGVRRDRADLRHRHHDERPAGERSHAVSFTAEL